MCLASCLLAWNLRRGRKSEEKALGIVISDTNLTRDGPDISVPPLPRGLAGGWEEAKKALTLISTASRYDHVWLQPQPVRSDLPSSTDRKSASL